LDPSWANEGPSYGELVLRMMFSVYNTLRVSHLPPSFAGEEETPKAHAERVRTDIAARLHVPLTSFKQEDNVLGIAAKRLGFPASIGHIGLAAGHFKW
jgi:hypothetical protein